MTEVLCRWSGAARLLLRLHPTYAGQLGVVRAASNNPTQSDSSAKPPLKKPKTPQGRLDETEETTKEREPLENPRIALAKNCIEYCICASSQRLEAMLQKLKKGFPDNINPITKEKGGPRGPEPTRYGDWERKGRCIDF